MFTERFLKMALTLTSDSHDDVLDVCHCRLSKNNRRLSLRRRPHAKCEGRVSTQTQTSRPLSNAEVVFPILDADLVPNTKVTFQLKHKCRTSSITDARVTFYAKCYSHCSSKYKHAWICIFNSTRELA